MRSQGSIILSVLVLFVLIYVPGCKTVEPIQYSSNSDAIKLYVSGESYLNDGLYELAIREFKKSISIDGAPFLPHTKLAVAYYGKKDYLNAAKAFESATNVMGGANNSGPIPVMMALSLMRAGQREDAKKLLHELTGPEVVVTTTGSYNARSGRAYGVWKDASNYLLSNIDEDAYLSKVPKSDMSFPYLIIGIKAVVDNKDDKAEMYLSKAATLARAGTWRYVMIMEELIAIKKKKSNG